jgi:hypothetical protein
MDINAKFPVLTKLVKIAADSTEPVRMTMCGVVFDLVLSDMSIEDRRARCARFFLACSRNDRLVITPYADGMVLVSAKDGQSMPARLVGIAAVSFPTLEVGERSERRRIAL